MNKEQYQDKLQSIINKLKTKYVYLNENDHYDKFFILGQINGLLQAKIWLSELEN